MLPSVVQLQVRGRSAAGEGSGFVISTDGLIVTNNHVIEAAADGARSPPSSRTGGPRRRPSSGGTRHPTSPW
ncbi:hypothetical protein ACFQV2_03635 [Actinokineospora soli]|uniref:Trypsin-like peptidase domain-containing protein n=1 Tax=Actinokineospora soli TaxID=1048753 RepID=A0ABW2TGL4_9PSEU